jgi:AcrR family transcriptional regulator
MVQLRPPSQHLSAESVMSPTAAMEGPRPQAAPARTPGARRGRPTLAQAGDLRQRMLDAAFASFQAHGFEATAMEAVARAAGVAKLTLYRHFETKEVLFEQVVRRAQARVRRSLEARIDRRAPLEPVLRECIARLHEGFTQAEYLAVMRLVIAEGARFPRLGRTMLDDAQRAARPLAEYLREARARNAVRLDSPEQAATQLAGLASGAGRYVLTSPSGHPRSRRHTVEALVALFQRAWAVPDAAESAR